MDLKAIDEMRLLAKAHKLLTARTALRAAKLPGQAGTSQRYAGNTPERGDRTQNHIDIRGNQAGLLLLHLTWGCNAKCRHCVFECGPEKLLLSLTREEIRVAIRTAREHGILVMGLTGGEPTMAMDMVEFALEEGARSGMRKLHMTTNAFWATTPAKAREVLTRLVDLGLRHILVSYDHYHAEFVPTGHVLNACEQAQRLGLKIQISNTEACNETKRQMLDALGPTERLVWDIDVQDSNTQPPVHLGRGVGLSEAELELGGMMRFQCAHFECHFPIVSVFPGQLTAFCCGYANPRLTYRYPLKANWLDDMMAVWNSDRCVLDMWHKGLAEISGIEAQPGMPCNYCWELLARLYPDKELIDVRALK